jgi:hypothetical protein
MKSKHKPAGEKQNYSIGRAIYRPLFPRPICLEKCTMNIPNGYETDILMTLKAFSSQESYRRNHLAFRVFFGIYIVPDDTGPSREGIAGRLRAISSV